MKDHDIPLAASDLRLLIKTDMSIYCRKHTNQAVSTMETRPTLEDLVPILEMCERCYKLSYHEGNISYFFVNGKLLFNVRRLWWCGEGD